MIYNASAYEAVEDEKLRDFLHFVSTNEPDENGFSKTLSDTVAKLKEDEIFRKDYAAMNLHDRDIKKAAKEEGRNEQAIENAKTMLADELSPEKVSQYSGLPIEKIHELQEKAQ